MAEKVGIKELTEAVEFIEDLVIFLVKEVFPGVDFTDALKIVAALSAPPLSIKLKAAYDGYKAIPAEMADLSLDEVLVLVSGRLRRLPEILSLLQKR